MDYKPEEELNNEGIDGQTGQFADQQPAETPSVETKIAPESSMEPTSNSESEIMSEEKHGGSSFVVSVVILVLVILGVGYYFWNNSSIETEYSVKGVPYTELASSIPFSVYSILGYYGDDRFTSEQIESTFVHDPEQTEFAMENIAEFFELSGYSAINKVAMTVSKIKKSIDSDIPVIIYRNLVDTDSENINVFVVTGYSDMSNTVTVNDNLRGESVSMSYDDFANLVDGDNQEVLSITPTPQLDGVVGVE